MSERDDEAALTNLILGRTATAAAHAIIAAGWRAPEPCNCIYDGSTYLAWHCAVHGQMQYIPPVPQQGPDDVRTGFSEDGRRYYW